MISRTIGLSVIAIFSSFESVFGQSEVEQPLTAIAKSTQWTEVFENAFDLEVTLHYGGTEGVARWETICKCRQIYDERGGIVFTPWAIGSVDVDPKQSPQASDFRQRRLRVVEQESLYEINFLAKSEGKRVPCGKDCLKRSSPLDVMHLVANPKVYDLTITRDYDLSKIMNLLTTLRPDQLTSTNETIEGRKMQVYRIKTDPHPKGVALPVYRMVVAESGFDSGLMNEFHTDYMRMGDERKYEQEDQLVKSTGNFVQKIRWEEISITRNGTSRKIVLPVSVTKKRVLGQEDHKGYLNVSLNWRSFTSESKKICSESACDKLSAEFMTEIDKALGR